MSTSDLSYRLVIFDPPDDPPAVRDLFVKVTGAHPTDAMQWVARTPGVWPKPLDEIQVRALLDGLFDLEIAAEAWRADVFPEFGPIRTIHEVACLDEGFRVKGLRGEPTHWVPWNKFELISGGRIETEDEYRDISPPTWVSAIGASARFFMGRKPTPYRSSRALRVPRDPRTELILVRKEPRVTFRIVALQMNYAYLGDRLATSSAENFPLLLTDIVNRAGEAFATEPTRILLEGGDEDEALFLSTQSLVDYSLHRLLWSWYRRDRDKEQRTLM